MYKIYMLVRASWLVAASYRIRMLLSLGSLLAVIVPLYFIANALQPVMAESIATQGGQYFAFLLVGMMVYPLLVVSVNGLPSTISGGIGSGTFEAMLTTPTSMPTLFSGWVGYALLWTAARSGILLIGGWLLGMQIMWGQLLPALGILVLIVLAHLPFGLLGAALVLAFRTTGPLPQGVLILSALLGGVYYPTHVIPSWIQHVSDFVPLTYGLRALRRTLLEGLPLLASAGDLAILSLAVVVLFVIATLAFSAALRYSKRVGTLAHY